MAFGITKITTPDLPTLVTKTIGSGTSNTLVITDPGLILVMPSSNVKAQVQNPANTWTDIMAAGNTDCKFIPSDGSNTRFISSSTGATQTVTYYLVQ